MGGAVQSKVVAAAPQAVSNGNGANILWSSGFTASKYVWERLGELLSHWESFFNSIPWFEELFNTLEHGWNLFSKYNNLWQNLLLLCITGQTLLWACEKIRAIFNGEMLREKASNKVLEEKKVIVGWNCFEVKPEESDKLPEPKAPTSMSKDIKLFKKQVSSKSIHLSLLTEGNLRIDNFITDELLVKNYLKAAQRTVDDETFVSDETLEDFLIIFDYAKGDHGLGVHVFSKLIEKEWEKYYGKALAALFCCIVPQILLPPGKWETLQVILYNMTWFLSVVISMAFSYYWAAAVIHRRVYGANKYLVKILLGAVAAGLTAMVVYWVEGHQRLVASGFGAIITLLCVFGISEWIYVASEEAAKILEGRRSQDQNNVMLGVFNQISEKLASSHWPVHCSKRVRPVPNEFWQMNKSLRQGQYLLACACEKEPGISVTCTRAWLVHPYDLYLLTQITQEEIENFDVDVIGKLTDEEVKVNKKLEEKKRPIRYFYAGHKRRILNLRKWALNEFNKDGVRKVLKEKKHTSFSVTFPDFSDW